MNTDQVYIWIGVIIVGAVIAYLLGHRKGKANVAAGTAIATTGAVASTEAAIKAHIAAGVADLKSHVSAIGTVLRTDIKGVGTSAPTAAPVVGATTLASTFPNAAALKVAIVAQKINYMVTLDGAQINSGFGPAQAFFTQADGAVSTTPAAPAASVAEAPPPVAAAPFLGPSAGAVGTEATVAHVRNQYGSCNFTDKLPATSCALADALFIAKMDMPFKILVGSRVGNATLDFCILSGSQAAINQAMNTVYNSHEPEIAKFNVSTYMGPLKGRYDSLVAGIEAGTVAYLVLYSDTGTTT
jgi:hypothetical protein